MPIYKCSVCQLNCSSEDVCCLQNKICEDCYEILEDENREYNTEEGLNWEV